VEHSCQQCGNVVEDGRPFCPQCRAPQIHVRVALADDAPPIPAAEEPSTEGVHPGFLDRPRAMPGTTALGVPLPEGTVDTKTAFRAVVKAGLLGVLIGIIPLLGIMLAGALAVFFYRRKRAGSLPAAVGARLGGGAGVVIFAVNALFTIPIIVFHEQQECVDSIVAVANKYGLDTSSPQFQASVRNIFTGSGLASFLIFAVILGAFGGTLAALFFRSGNRS
jgi:hypothetical protein